MTPAALPPGSVIGILGGGQLGRMLALAAARLGLRAHIFDPVAGGPAAQVTAWSTTADWDDTAALERFAAACDAVTYEFENIPAAALDAMERHAPVRPGRRALETSQDRWDEKSFLTSIGLPTAPHRRVDSAAELAAALDALGTPAILKTRRLGYDGKGQVRITSPEDGPAAWEALSPQGPLICEGFVEFSMEISVIAARGLDGGVAAFDPGRNVHEDGILATTDVPGGIPSALRTDAVVMASRLLSELDYVGVVGVEFFVAPGGLLVNEFAPRVHNSGHWTQAGCAIDQFEQHIRAVAGWPLGDGRRHADVTMTNLIGAAADGWADVSGDQLHLYGKAESRPGRKMGHINRIRRE